jgi:hypothetical protein
MSEAPMDKKLPEKVAGILRPRNIVVAGALAAPYVVGRKVQQQQQQQVPEKTAAFLAGLVDGLASARSG